MLVRERNRKRGINTCLSQTSWQVICPLNMQYRLDLLFAKVIPVVFYYLESAEWRKLKKNYGKGKRNLAGLVNLFSSLLQLVKPMGDGGYYVSWFCW